MKCKILILSFAAICAIHSPSFGDTPANSATPSSDVDTTAPSTAIDEPKIAPNILLYGGKLQSDLRGVTVAVSNNDHRIVAAGIVDDKGVVNDLYLAPGTYSLEIRLRGFLLRQVNAFSVSATDQTQHKILAPTGMVIGRITNAGGAPIVNAVVGLISAKGSLLQVRSDVKGEYICHFVPAGTYAVFVTADNAQPKLIKGIDIKDGQKLSLDVLLKSK